MRPILACLFVLGLPAGLEAQGSQPLRKTDLIRLLSSPLIRTGEVADLIRRNCLAFRPTQRDWVDLRNLGADAEVKSSIAACVSRTAAPTPPTVRPVSTGALSVPVRPTGLTARPIPSRLTAVAGTEALVRVETKRGDGAQAGVELILRGSAQIPGGPATDLQAMTDDSGVALFLVPAGRQPGTYRLEIVSGTGAAFPGRPAVEVVVRAGAPAVADVRPDRLELGGEQQGPVAVQVAVRDSLGNPVPNEPLELRPQLPDMGVPPSTRSSDSLGRAVFVLEAAAIKRPGPIELRARGVRLAALEAVLPGPASGVATGFVSGVGQRATAGTRLVEALTFQARSSSGRPLSGRVVLFRAVNAQVAPDSAVTDAAGQVRTEVALGTRAGNAVVTATVDGVQKQATLYVDPGPAVELVVEREGARVDGGRVVANLGTPFDLRVGARDGYGNPVPAAPLARLMQEKRRELNARLRLLQLLRIEADSLATILTFKPVGLGVTELRIGAGLTTSLSVEVVPPGK